MKTCDQCKKKAKKLYDYGGGIHLCKECYDEDLAFEQAFSEVERKRGY